MEQPVASSTLSHQRGHEHAQNVTASDRSGSRCGTRSITTERHRRLAGAAYKRARPDRQKVDSRRVHPPISPPLFPPSPRPPSPHIKVNGVLPGPRPNPTCGMSSGGGVGGEKNLRT